MRKKVIAGAWLTWQGASDAPENAPTLRHRLGLTATERRGYLLTRSLRCTDCHAIEQNGVTIGGSDDHPDAPNLDELDHEPNDLADILEDPKGMLSEDTEMPNFEHVSYEQRRAVGVYIKSLIEWREQEEKERQQEQQEPK